MPTLFLTDSEVPLVKNALDDFECNVADKNSMEYISCKAVLIKVMKLILKKQEEESNAS
jgi:hypothetical protein